jgi:hypothetical protein
MQCFVRQRKKEDTPEHRLSLDGVLSLGEVDLLLLLLLGNEAGFVLGESSTDGTGVLGAEVQGSVLLALVEESTRLLIINTEDLSLAHHT